MLKKSYLYCNYHYVKDLKEDKYIFVDVIQEGKASCFNV
jgi:hypothetical protein